MADRNGYIGRAPGDSSVIVSRQTFSPTGVTTDFTFCIWVYSWISRFIPEWNKN